MARIPRIPAPVVDRLPPPVVEAIEPPVVEFTPPPVLTPNPPSIDVPDFDPPSYEPIDVPERPPNNPPSMGPSQQEPEEEEEETDRPGVDIPNLPATQERPVIEVPFTGTEVPLPYPREVALAGTTAVAATAAALLGKSMVEILVKRLKPLVKKIMLKIKERQGKQFSDYELQQFFEFENRVPDQKALMKRLKKEQKAEKAAQLEAELQRRQRKQKRKES